MRNPGRFAALISTFATILMLGACAFQEPPSSNIDPKRIEEIHAKAIESHSPPTTLPLPADPKVWVIGDSWTRGQGADPTTLGYAHLLESRLGWPTEVFGAAGTGYTVDSPNIAYDRNQMYRVRIERLPETAKRVPDPNIIIVQGSTNDFISGVGRTQLAARDTIGLLRRMHPDAAIVLLGPITNPASPLVGAFQSLLWTAASEHNAAFINPHRGGQVWFGPKEWTSLMGEDGHPSTVGHSYLADRVVGELRRLFAVD
ncbi:SGNH/GDSL hydrolase family protein [Rhodococcus pyridinivorans]|uniref:SGNH/GDSL hydrolase family protein n=1 Tax=Rhodococcus pyridinivorans TaxID=103816 RepID=UPI00265B4B9F|nr:SGNH/GDSL hydrolase family protein [Rhodococcus pyridinivorans]